MSLLLTWNTINTVFSTLTNGNGLLTMGLVSFYTLWKHQKTSGFLFLGGIYRKRSVPWNGLIEELHLFSTSNLTIFINRFMNAMICAVLASGWYKNRSSDFTVKYEQVTAWFQWLYDNFKHAFDFGKIQHGPLICQIKTEDLYFSIQCNQSTEWLINIK